MKVADVHIQLSNNGLSNTYSYEVDDKIVVGDCVIIDINNRLKVGYVFKIDDHDEKDFDFKVKKVLLKVDFLSLNTYQKILFKAVYQSVYSDFANVYKLFFANASSIKFDVEYIKGDEVSFHSEKSKKENEQYALDKDVIKRVIISNLKKPLQQIYITLLNNNRSADLTKRQQEVVDIIEFDYHGTVSYKTLKNEMKISDSIINKLIDKKVVLKKSVDKKFNERYLINTDSDLELTLTQQKAVDEIFSNQNITLLHGVTASGKTEVYIKYIESLISDSDDNQVLLIAPQMGLALQLVSRIQNQFDDVIIYHDKLSDGEKISYYEQIKNSKTQVVIGTKESLFLPFTNLKAVIIDEEHSDSYKSKKLVKYDIHDTLLTLKENDIKVILGSATPSIDSYIKAQKGIYDLVTLDKRYNDFSYPQVKFIDKKQDELSQELKDMITINKNLNRTSLVYFHKSGYSKVVECEDCYHIFKCPTCDIPLTYYHNINKCKCQFCGYKEDYTNKCPSCNSHNISHFNMGIEKFYELLTAEFKDYKIALLDSQKKKDEILEILTKYNDNYYDIILGSQIMSQGLNFLDITNAYIVNIDELLFIKEYNANEKTFNLISQIIGRVGRNLKYSEVYVETNHQDHFVMQAVQKNDYLTYFNEELENRRILKNPPYFNICRVELRHKNSKLLDNLLIELQGVARNNKLIVSEINTPYIERIGDDYRKYIHIKYKRENIKALIKTVYKRWKMNKVKSIIDLKMKTNGK